MNQTIRFTRPCRAELIRLLGALAEQDLQLAENTLRLLEQNLQALQQGISSCNRLNEQHPSLHIARLELGALEIGLVFDVEAEGVLTMLAVQL